MLRFENYLPVTLARNKEELTDVSFNCCLLREK